MQKIQTSIRIHAPAKRVWDALLGEETYPLWTDVFAPGSRAEGDWSEGSKMLFLMDYLGTSSGMVSVVEVARPYEQLRLKHIGYVQDGVEDTTSAQVRSWAPAYETYTLREDGAQTEFELDMDVEETHADYMRDTWHIALRRLKEIAETGTVRSITVGTMLQVPRENVWEFWTNPEHVKQWNAASDDWHTPQATADVRTGGKFVYTMAAREGSESFDCAGTYTSVKPYETIESQLADKRRVHVQFHSSDKMVHVRQTFDLEPTHSLKQQRVGWQAIMDRFRHYVLAQHNGSKQSEV